MATKKPNNNDKKTSVVKYIQLTFCTVALTLSVEVAWSHNTHHITNKPVIPRETPHQKQNPTSDLAKQCFSLLDTTQTHPHFAKSRNQRAVGHVTALGIMLGARFALKPDIETADLHKNKAKTTKTALQNTKRTAHTITRYRQCLKQVALNKRAVKNDV